MQSFQSSKSEVHLSNRDDYENKIKEWEAAGFLELARRRGTCNAPHLNDHRPNRTASFISRHVTLTVLLVLFTATGSLAYFNPEFRQWADEAVSKAVSKVASFIGPDYSTKTGQFLVSRGNALRVKKQYAEAEYIYEIAIDKFTLKENWQGLGNAYTELGILHTRTKNYKAAEAEFQKALNYFGWAGDRDGRGYSLIKLGQLHYFQRHFKSAHNHFLASKQHYKSARNQEGLGNVALSLANLFVAKRNYKKANKHFIEAEFRFKMIRSKRGLVNTYNSLAHAFQALRTKRGKEEAAQYRQLAKAIELDTQSTPLPKFSIQESFAWLTDAFNQNRDAYESELNSKAKQETERVVR